MRKTIVITVVVVAVVAGLGFFGLQRLQAAQASQTNLQTAQVRRGSLTATIGTAGTIQPSNSINLSFQTSGTVKEIKVNEGDPVKAGQVIATLDAADVQLQVTQAELNLQSAQLKLQTTKKGPTPEQIAAAKASLASAEENLKALQAGPSANDIEVARLKYEQAKDQLWSAQCQRDATCGKGPGVACDQANASVSSATMAVEIARIQYEQAQQGPTDKDLRAAEAQVAQARLNLANLTSSPTPEDIQAAENAVKQAQVALDQAKLKLAPYTLTAPFDGTVARLSLQVGQMVGANTQVGLLSVPDSFDITADMSEVDVARVKVGQEVNITLDALPDRTFKGHVTKVATVGTSTQGVVNYPVTIHLDEADPAIKPGMTANASIIVDQRDNVLLVPSRAIRTQGNQRLVRVLFQGQTIDVPVQVGLSGDNGTEVLGDTLKEGDEVVLNVTASQTQRGLGIPGMGGVMRFGR